MSKLLVFILGLVIGGGAVYSYFGAPTARPPSPAGTIGTLIAAPGPVFDPEAYQPGQTWPDLDGDCQDARTEVLLALGLDVEMDDTECTVISGRWRDMFTGLPLDHPDKVAVVPIVPLREAHESGAATWPVERKRAFANGFERAKRMTLKPVPPLTSNLTTVSLTTKKARGDKPITEWLPEGHQRQCDYAEAWVVVKARWGLTMDQEERDKVASILSLCP